MKKKFPCYLFRTIFKILEIRKKKEKKRNYELHSRYRHVFVSRTKLKKIKRIIIKVSLLIKNFAIEIIQRSIKRISENDRKEKKKNRKENSRSRGGGEGERGEGGGGVE